MNAREAAEALARLGEEVGEVPGLRMALRTIAGALREDRLPAIEGRLDNFRRERLLCIAGTRSTYYRTRDLDPDKIDFEASIWIWDHDHEPGTFGDVSLMFSREESAADFVKVFGLKPVAADPCRVPIGDTSDLVVLPDEYAWLEPRLEGCCEEYERANREAVAALTYDELRAMYCVD